MPALTLAGILDGSDDVRSWRRAGRSPTAPPEDLSVVPSVLDSCPIPVRIPKAVSGDIPAQDPGVVSAVTCLSKAALGGAASCSQPRHGKGHPEPVSRFGPSGTSGHLRGLGRPEFNGRLLLSLKKSPSPPSSSSPSSSPPRFSVRVGEPSLYMRVHVPGLGCRRCPSVPVPTWQVPSQDVTRHRHPANNEKPQSKINRHEQNKTRVICDCWKGPAKRSHSLLYLFRTKKMQVKSKTTGAPARARRIFCSSRLQELSFWKKMNTLQ